MSGLSDVQHIPRKLQNGVLTPATCSKERPPCLARETNSAERSLHRTIRTGRHTPESSVLGLQISIQRKFGIEPHRLDQVVIRPLEPAPSEWLGVP